jgi:hypothetical protein
MLVGGSIFRLLFCGLKIHVPDKFGLTGAAVCPDTETRNVRVVRRNATGSLVIGGEF